MIQEYIWWILLAIAALVGTYITMTIKRRRSARLLTSTGSTVIQLDKQPSKTTTKYKHLKYANISIKCPELQLPHSDIWGTDEELQIVCQLLDENGQPIMGRAIQITIEDGEIDEVITDNQGMSWIEHVYNHKGIYNISCRFEGDEVYASCSHQKTIRVVDYREEAASLFDSMKKSAISNGIVITSQSTPREIEATLRDAFVDIDHAKLDKFIHYLEESLYSSHPFERDHYADMLANYSGNCEPSSNLSNASMSLSR